MPAAPLHPILLALLQSERPALCEQPLVLLLRIREVELGQEAVPQSRLQPYRTAADTALRQVLLPVSVAQSESPIRQQQVLASGTKQPPIPKDLPYCNPGSFSSKLLQSGRTDRR